MKSRTVDFLLENHFAGSLLGFATLLAALATSSLALVFLSGILAFGWPFFYVFLLDVKEKSATEEKAPAKRVLSLRPNVVGAR
jgi:hypothetical protein